MTHLNTGDQAPAFTGMDQHGNTISLSDFKGQLLILYFYPKDDTPGCTAEACNLRDHHDSLLEKGLAVVGISPDPLTSHKKFSEKYQLPFPLIPDPEKKILTDYGVWGEKNMYGKKYMGVHRTTFVIDESGVIRHIFTKVDTSNHTEQILQTLGL